MSKLSRRSLVSSAATLPALAVPAVASAVPASADVELQQLGVRLLKENRNFNALCSDPNPDDKEVDEASGRIAALMPPIFSKTATTRDGLAVQAAAAAIACRELWDGVGDWSSSDNPSWQVERPFIEAVCRHTGVAHPVIDTKRVEVGATLADEPETPDPVFAAMDAYKSAVEADRAASLAADDAVGRVSRRTGMDYLEALRDPSVMALDDASKTTAAERVVKRNALLKTIPTTGEGLCSLLTFVADREEVLLDFKEIPGTAELTEFLTTVAQSVRTLAGWQDAPAST
jgi:hypothetical protein